MSSVTEGLMTLGSFEVRLKPETPTRFLDKLTKRLGPNELAGFFSHVVITRERVDIDAIGASSFVFPGSDVFPSTDLFPLRSGIWEAAAYAGIIRRLPTGDDLALRGVGMEGWLGDEDKGEVYEATKGLTDASPLTMVETLRPAAVMTGKIFDVGTTFTGAFKFTTPRHAIRYACDAMGIEYRVNPDATIDIGQATQLYGESAVAVVARKGTTDPEWATLIATSLALEADGEDYSTRVVVLSGDSDNPALAGSADLEQETEYRNVFGSALKVTRIADETSEENVPGDQRALFHLNRFNAERRTLSLSVSEYDVEGSHGPGFWVNVYDPEAGLVDLGNEVTFHGRPIWPKKVRVVGSNWPIKRGMGVYHRDHSGVFTDISEWVEWGDGDTELEIGALSRSIFDAA